jgi:hypothetical protein
MRHLNIKAQMQNQSYLVLSGRKTLRFRRTYIAKKKKSHAIAQC